MHKPKIGLHNTVRRVSNSEHEASEAVRFLLSSARRVLHDTRRHPNFEHLSPDGADLVPNFAPRLPNFALRLMNFAHRLRIFAGLLPNCANPVPSSACHLPNEIDEVQNFPRLHSSSAAGARNSTLRVLQDTAPPNRPRHLACTKHCLANRTARR